MTILVLGSGGREHALCWKLRQSPQCGQLFCAPGNPGTQRAGAQNVPDLPITDPAAVVAFVRERRVDLVVIGPEAPLMAGVTDALLAQPDLQHVPVVGPCVAGARLEGSKAFSKAFMRRHGVPTAAAQIFTTSEVEQALAYVRTHPLPVVLKADGLAQGKGVVVAQTTAEAEAALRRMLVEGEFGEAGATVLVEEFLAGRELSVFILTGGLGYAMLPTAQDYKRVGVGDTGANTGGMGAVSPAPAADEPFMQRVRAEVIEPTIMGLKADKIPYQGFLFIGIMRVGDAPFVIEYNVRLGDPEAQAILPRLQTDLIDMFAAMHERRASYLAVHVDPRPTCAVVLTAQGYPSSYSTGDPIEGLARAEAQTDALVFQAGTRLTDDSRLVTAGGRVLSVVARATTAAEAAVQAHQTANAISWPGVYRRADVGV